MCLDLYQYFGTGIHLRMLPLSPSIRRMSASASKHLPFYLITLNSRILQDRFGKRTQTFMTNPCDTNIQASIQDSQAELWNDFIPFTSLIKIHVE